MNTQAGGNKFINVVFNYYNFCSASREYPRFNQIEYRKILYELRLLLW